MGGVGKRLIRSVRKILSALLSERTLTDEGMAKLMVEVEAMRSSTLVLLRPPPLTPKMTSQLLQTIFYFKRLPRFQHQVFSERTTGMLVDVGGKYSGWQISSGDVGLESICLLFFHDRNGQPNEAIFSSVMLFLSRAMDIRETTGRWEAFTAFFPTVEILFDKWK